MSFLTTGKGASITFVTSGFVCRIRNLVPPEESREALDVTTYDVEDDFFHYEPDDLIEGGEVQVSVLYDPTVTPPTRNVLEKIQLAYPNNQGMVEFDGFATKFAPKLELKTKAIAEVTIKVASAPVFTPGASA